MFIGLSTGLVNEYDHTKVFHKDKNNCYYNIFLEKDSYELPKK